MTFRELLEMRAEKDGGKPFVYFKDQIIDFVTLDRKVNKAANLLRDLGVKKGDHVCLFLPNCPEFLYLWFGLSKIGAIMVPLNTRLHEDGLADVINNSDSKRIVVNEALYDAFNFVERDLKGIEQKIWHGEGNPSPENYYCLNTLMESASENAPPAVNIKDGDPLAILYTSGTTGPPKGAMISQFNYINIGTAWAKDIIGYREDDIIFSTLPLFHANAQMFTVMSCLVSGRPHVLGERFSPTLFFNEVRQYGATVLNFIGSMVTVLMKEPERENDSNNPARIASCGGTPREIWEDFEKRFNLTLIEGYGLTETGGVCLMNPRDKIKKGSIGKPTKFCDVTIWDENNREIPIGQNGEIVVKEKIPYSMFLGYYKQPDRTEEVWRGGRFHTGDMGYKDEEGYFFFIDRIKDCIRSHGQHVSSLEIEAIIKSNPKVLESAAVGIFSEFGEDEIKIYVIVKPDEKLEVEELIAFCEERMPYFWVPRYVEFVKELPKTSTQKIKKFELKARGIGNAWDLEKTGYKLKMEKGVQLRLSQISQSDNQRIFLNKEEE
jgi:crotonobetaine/carnitine-CoA ligase